MFFHYLKHTQHQPIRLFAGFFSALQFFFSSLSFDLSFVIALNKQPFRAIESCAICNWSLGWNVNLILILYAIGNKHVNKRAPLWFTTHRNRLIVCVRPGFFIISVRVWCAVFTIWRMIGFEVRMSITQASISRKFTWTPESGTGNSGTVIHSHGEIIEPIYSFHFM